MPPRGRTLGSLTQHKFRDYVDRAAPVRHHRDMRQVPLRIDLTLEQATDAWLSAYSSANTRAAYASDLKAFLSWYGDDAAALAATAEVISEYRACLLYTSDAADE